MTLYHRQAMHLFALTQKAKEESNQTTEYLIWGSKVRKVFEKLFLGRKHVLTKLGNPLPHVSQIPIS